MENRIKVIIAKLKQKLEELYGSRLKQLIVYGSYAREQQTENSDIDIAVVLDGDISKSAEISRMIEAITDLNLEYSVLISVYPVSSGDYASINSPLMINLRREGVAV
jgi:predicted nucleotidyltransferase